MGREGGLSKPFSLLALLLLLLLPLPKGARNEGHERTQAHLPPQVNAQHLLHIT